MNRFKTFFLMLILMLIFIVVGSMAGGRDGAIFASFSPPVMNFFAYWFSDKIVLAIIERTVTANEAPSFHGIGAELTQASIPCPRSHYGKRHPNGVCHGEKSQHAAVAVNQGSSGSCQRTS